MKTLLSNLAVFMPQVMSKHFTEIKNAYISVIKKILLEKLNESQKKLFELSNYHFWDPNDQEKGKNMDLLEFLIFESLGGISTTEHEDWFSIKINFNDDRCRELTGVSLNDFKKRLYNLKRSWRHVADIDVHENNELFFRLLRRENFHTEVMIDHFRKGLRDKETGKYDGNNKEFEDRVKLLEGTSSEIAIAYSKGYNAFPEHSEDTITDLIIFNILAI